MKNFLSYKYLLILVIMSAGCLAISLLFSQKVQRANNDLTQERYLRMVAEEMLEKMKLKVRALENDIKKFQAEAEKSNALLQGREDSLKNLKQELEKTERLNYVLQEQLKNALIQQK